MSELTFWVPGIPEPQGSTRPFRGRGKSAGKIFTTSANKDLRPWRNAVTSVVQRAISLHPQAQTYGRYIPAGLGGVRLVAQFYFPRPKGHFGKKGLLPSAPKHHTVKPDLSKLVRAIEDSLTDAGIWHDDNQVISTSSAKQYADDRPPGVQITVYPLPDPATVPVHAPPGVSAHAATQRTGIRRELGPPRVPRSRGAHDRQ